MSKDRTKELEAFARVLDVMDELRAKCPWDAKQTIESIRPLTIEETYELSDAILSNDMPNVCKELGDIMMHIVFYSIIAKENGKFDIVEVMNKMCDKLIYRHPHVFSTEKVKDAEQVLQNWEQLKTKEKDGNKTILSGVPESLPGMIKAYRMQDKARAVGFDWANKEDVWDKVKDYVTRAGPVIFVASIIMWLLLNCGPTGIVEDMGTSFGAILGKVLVPVFAPVGLGYWQIIVALLSGLAAKEVVVASCGVLFGIQNMNSDTGMAELVPILAAMGFGAVNAYALMTFCLLYTPCTATLATIKRESGSWAWTGQAVAFQLAVAWVVTFVVYHVGNLLF